MSMLLGSRFTAEISTRQAAKNAAFGDTKKQMRLRQTYAIDAPHVVGALSPAIGDATERFSASWWPHTPEAENHRSEARGNKR